jgi:hypothetical protein
VSSGPTDLIDQRRFRSAEQPEYDENATGLPGPKPLKPIEARVAVGRVDETRYFYLLA